LKTFDAYTLKWIAIIGMALNHMAHAWFEILPPWLLFPLYAAGGLTFPIIAHLTIDGYRHTSNIKKYMLRLLTFAVISMPFHYLVVRAFSPNILFVIVLSLVALLLYDKMKSRLLFWVTFVALVLITFIFVTDWFIIGPIVVLLTYTIKDEKKRRVVPAIVAGLFWLVLSVAVFMGLRAIEAYPDANIQMGVPYHWTHINFVRASTTFIIGCIAAAFILLRYNGERGKPMKWAFYVAYPLHLAVLGGVALALGLVSLPF